ncbi:MAG TPA: DUF6328 family protein [Phototrophicaceae bacterium]|nr:DUF6328 family protein [Phototrophicaceae bacterium]
MAVTAAQTPLKDQIKHALDEILTLITGAEILIGFQYTAVFNKLFATLPEISQYLQVLGLVFLLITLILIMSPVPYHWIAEGGQATRRLCDYVRGVVLIALLFFAFGLGIDAYIVVEVVGGSLLGVVGGSAAGLAALGFWYAIEYARRRADKRAHRKPFDKMNEDEIVPDVTLADKVDHVLTEARVVLPGAQALLGFQFIAVLAEGFDSLSMTAKYLHLLGLALIALSTILLMTPAAYHRIVEEGEDTEHFRQLASRFVLAAMVALALGIILNFYIVVAKVTASPLFAIASTFLMLLLFFGFWFGYTFYQRRRKQR